jgi:hypothetical protein
MGEEAALEPLSRVGGRGAFAGGQEGLFQPQRMQLNKVSDCLGLISHSQRKDDIFAGIDAVM